MSSVRSLCSCAAFALSLAISGNYPNAISVLQPLAMSAAGTAQDGAQPAIAAGEAADGAKPERHRHGRRDRNRDFRKPREGAPVEAGAPPPAEGAPAPEVRADNTRPPRERFEGKGKDNENRREKFGGDRNKGDRESFHRNNVTPR